jgi:hypothetical protein
MNRFLLTTCFAAHLVLAACGGDSDRSRAPKGEIWRPADSVLLAQPKPLKGKPALEVLLTEAYPFRNLHVQFRLRRPPIADTCQLVEVALMDSLGTWRAPANWQGRRAYQVPVPAFARGTGPQALSARLWMRPDSLPGVARVSLSAAQE